MKFDLAESEVKVLEGKIAQLPYERFEQLLDYVDDLEARLLAAEINLREADRVGREMDQTLSSADSRKPLSKEDVQHVQKVFKRLEPELLRRAAEEKGISLRKLAVISGIPYATLYRYLNSRSCPPQAATKIWLTLEQVKREDLLPANQ
jgi:Helix-turn-helix